VASHKKDAAASPDGALLHFITQRLTALSDAFAASPLAHMRVSTPEGSVTMTKRSSSLHESTREGHADRRHAGRPPHSYSTEGAVGRSYDTVCADVVGVFHAAADLPEPGEIVESDRVLGYIEALRLRTPVVAGISGRLVGQVAEDGQPVDFGETLFVIDDEANEASANGAAEAPAAQEMPADIEPPRI
jgi:biotin carboxyl carrier protein